MKPFIPVFFIFSLPLLCSAQVDTSYKDTVGKHEIITKSSISVFTGYYYYKRSGGELGLGTKQEVQGMVHPFSSGMYASCEFYNDKSWFVGPKVGAWMSGGSGAMTMGLSLIDYTNFEKSSVQFRLEIGCGIDGIRFYYGRNMRITNQDYNGISKDLFGMNVLLDIKKLKEQHFYPGQSRRRK